MALDREALGALGTSGSKERAGSKLLLRRKGRGWKRPEGEERDESVLSEPRH